MKCYLFSLTFNVRKSYKSFFLLWLKLHFLPAKFLVPGFYMQESLLGDKLNDKMYRCNKIAGSVISKTRLISLFPNSFRRNVNVFKR